MIVKAIPRPRGRTFVDTAAYLFDQPAGSNPARWHRGRGQTADNRVTAAWSTNCAVADPGLAIIEIGSMLRRGGKRSRATASYHLVLSFAPGETIDDSLMRAIEQTLLDSVGIGHHPRIAVRHGDRAQAHLHVLASRVDPISNRVAQLPYDHRRLMQISRAIEDECGLERVYHGEYRGRGPVPPGSRRESHDPYLGETDALLAARVTARFSQCKSRAFAARCEALADFRLDTILRKAAVAEEIAARLQALEDARPDDRNAVQRAARALKAEGKERSKAIVADAAILRSQVMAALPVPEWATWLEAEAKRGDHHAAVLLEQTTRRAQHRRGEAENGSSALRLEAVRNAPPARPIRSNFLSSNRVPSGQCTAGPARPPSVGCRPNAAETQTITSEEVPDDAADLPEHDFD